MKESEGVRSALLRFYDRNAANDQAAFPTIVSADPDLLVIGSAAREWFTGPEAVRGAYGLEGFRIDAGAVKAYERGELGYAVNTPVFTAPNGATLHLRMTTVFVKEDGAWKLLHMHASCRCRTKSRWRTRRTGGPARRTERPQLLSGPVADARHTESSGIAATSSVISW